MEGQEVPSTFPVISVLAILNGPWVGRDLSLFCWYRRFPRLKKKFKTTEQNKTVIELLKVGRFIKGLAQGSPQESSSQAPAS